MANMNHDDKNDNHSSHKHHVTPIPVYLRTFGALIFLTVLTVVTSYFDFGIMNLAIAMAIAATKAILVMLFFMQLKYDNLGNKVTFLSSFVFLGIFLALTSADFLFRPDVQAMKVESVAATGGETDPHQLHISTPALIAKGKALFAVQCVACHGANGLGDGAAAAALNPKPRNFHSGYWRYGGAPSIIFRTLTQGSPGTAMAAFTSLSVEQRYALAHFVDSIAEPAPKSDSDAELSEALKVAGPGAPQTHEIPIDYAMEQMEVSDQIVLPMDVANPTHPGAEIYAKHCSQCHGSAGQGAKVAALGQNPPAYLISKSFMDENIRGLSNEAEFIKVVSEGYPGRGMPGMSGYSTEQWHSLFDYVKGLSHQAAH